MAMKSKPKPEDNNPFTVDVSDEDGADKPSTMASSLDLALKIANDVDPFTVFRRSEDKKGHSDSIHVRIPQWWADVAKHVVEKSGGLFKNCSELYRDAYIKSIIFWLKHLDEIDPAVLAPFVLDAESNRRQCELQSIRETIENIKKTTKLFASMRDWEGLFTYLDQQLAPARSLRDPHRARVLKLINFERLKYGERFSALRGRGKTNG